MAGAQTTRRIWLVAAEAGHGGRRVVCVRACPFQGAHILVPVGTGLEMGLPGQLMLGGRCWGREGGLAPCPSCFPVCLDVSCEGGGGGGGPGFLPVVPSLPGCKTDTLPTPQSWSPHLSSRSFCTATSVFHSLHLPESPSPLPAMVFPAHSPLRRSRVEENEKQPQPGQIPTAHGCF